MAINTIKDTKRVVKVLSDEEIRKTRLRRFFILGAILIVGALVIYLIPVVFIASINGEIDSLELKGSLTAPQRQKLTDLQWSKVWWETKQTTISNPTSIILLAVGLVLIGYGLIIRFA